MDTSYSEIRSVFYYIDLLCRCPLSPARRCKLVRDLPFSENRTQSNFSYFSNIFRNQNSVYDIVILYSIWTKIIMFICSFLKIKINFRISVLWLSYFQTIFLSISHFIIVELYFITPWFIMITIRMNGVTLVLQCYGNVSKAFIHVPSICIVY